MPKITIICQQCGNEFRDYESNHRKFCSWSCRTRSMKGRTNHFHEKNQVVLTCLQCKQSFRIAPSRRTKAKYCSRKCYLEATHQKASDNIIQLHCLQCGREFWAKPGRRRRKYCSMKCVGRSNKTLLEGKSKPRAKPNVTLICHNCNRPFTVWPSQAHIRKYCSRKCYAESQQKRLTMSCSQCGKDFLVVPSVCVSGRRKYCSKKCRYEAHSQSFCGPNHPNWNGGSSFEPYPTTFNRRFKRMIRERDGYVCQICGDYGKYVHHIYYDKQNDCVNPSDFVTLCHSCHSKTNFNREHWIALLNP